MGKGSKKKRQTGNTGALVLTVDSPFVQGVGAVLADVLRKAEGDRAFWAAAQELQQRLGDVGSAHFGMGLAVIATQLGPKRAIATIRTFINGAARLLAA